MDRLKNILVAVDFSPCSAAALEQAVRIGELSRARVAATHVVDIPAYALPEGSFLPIELPPVDLLLSSAQERWDQWPPARKLGKKVVFDTVMGIRRMELIDRVRRDSIDLLVLGAHGETDARRGVGSVAAACVQRAPARVLVVREGQVAPFRSVAACIDFSDTSRLALEQAIRIAALDGSALHVLHVFEDPWHGAQPPKEIRDNMPDFAVRYRRAVAQHLRSFCEPLAHELGALKAELHALPFDSHGKGIVDFVTRERCDLVVLGTKAKWNLKEFFWGSTAERVVREAPCSALTVKPRGFDQK